MAEHSEEIEAACQTDITWVFGSSGQLTTQIAAGAPFGLLLSADVQYPMDLQRQELLVPNGVASYSVGRIVILTRQGIPPVTQLSDLNRPDIRKIAIANPDHAPYGRAAKQALESAAMYEVIQDRFVLGENIRQTTDYVEQGNADVGIVALALVIKGTPGEWTLIDADLHQPLEQGGGVVKGTGAELTGRCVLQFLLDPRGQALLQEYGFEPVTAR
jgi:molybdate transport system substrate-binding protein